MPLYPKQRKLLESLRQLEERGITLPRGELLSRLVIETGYKEVSTYLSKYLGSVVRTLADGRLEVRGVLAMSEDDFARLLTQKRLAAEAQVLRYDGREEWAAAIRALARHGAAHGYTVDAEDVELLRAVLGETA